MAGMPQHPEGLGPSSCDEKVARRRLWMRGSRQGRLLLGDQKSLESLDVGTEREVCGFLLMGTQGPRGAERCFLHSPWNDREQAGLSISSWQQEGPAALSG